MTSYLEQARVNSRSWNIPYSDVPTSRHGWVGMVVRADVWGRRTFWVVFYNCISPEACRKSPGRNYTSQAIPISRAKETVHSTWAISFLRALAPSPPGSTAEASHVRENPDEHELKYPANKHLWARSLALKYITLPQKACMPVLGNDYEVGFKKSLRGVIIVRIGPAPRPPGRSRISIDTNICCNGNFFEFSSPPYV
jgi:hypothetical protein